MYQTAIGGIWASLLGAYVGSNPTVYTRSTAHRGHNEAIGNNMAYGSNDTASVC